MDYYGHICDKTVTIKSKGKHFQSHTHNEFEKLSRKNTQSNFLISLMKMKFSTSIILFIRKISIYIPLGLNII